MTRANARTRILVLAGIALAASLALTPFAARPAAALSPALLPDLVVEQQPLDSPYAIEVTIINRGGGPASSFKVKYAGGWQTDIILIQNLAPGQQVNLYYPINAFGCATHTVTVDVNNAVVESNERNNLFREYVCIGY